MLIKIAKVLWVGVAVALLVITLYGYDGKPNSDIGIILALYGLFLSFPAGLLVSLVHVVLYDGFSIVVGTSYLSLVLDWLGFFVLGYLQWFKLLPYLITKLQTQRGHILTSWLPLALNPIARDQWVE